MPKTIAAIMLLCLCAASCGRHPNGMIKASGTIEAVTVDVAAKTGGQILRYAADEGSEVRPGDLLAEIDHAMLDLQLRQAQAGVELAKVQLDNDRTDSKRTGTLFASGSVTAKQRDDALARLLASQARYDQACAAADLVRKQIADCHVSAPAAGTVSTRAFEPGETVAPGATLATIAKLDTVNLMIYVTALELARVKNGQTAQVSIDAYRDRTFTGTVVFISPQAEFTPKNVQTKEDRVKQVFGVKLSVANPGRELKPGLPAEAVIRAQ
jgi:HlyD family secretion protein